MYNPLMNQQGPPTQDHVWSPDYGRPYEGPITGAPGTGSNPAAQGPNSPYRPVDDYFEGGLQTGIEGDVNYRLNLGIDPKFIDFAKTAYGSPYGNVDYQGQARAGQADAFTRKAKRNEMSAYHLDKMLASDSPLMRRAKQKAMAGAGSRGLMNSSIAQGAAMGAMIDRAEPFALQDARAHQSAATESLAAENQASLQNAQLRTQASIAGMQANAQRDQQLLGAELGGRQDVLRHMLGMETREDQQKWQKSENERSREWQTAERMGGQDFQDRQNRLAEQFQWSSDRQAATERWAEGELQLMMQRGSTREQALSQIAASIFGNPNLTAAEQNAAWENAQRIMGAHYSNTPGIGDYVPTDPTWSDPGYTPPPVGQSLSGFSTQPMISNSNRKMNHATGQVYNSGSTPNAAKVTEALPPLF